MRARISALPPALLAAIAIGVVGSGAALYGNLHSDPLPLLRAQELAWGTWFAGLALTSAGLFELSRRLTGGARRMVHAAGAIFALLALWLLCIDSLVSLGVLSRVRLGLWPFRIEGALTTAAAALIATAVGGWRRAPWASAVAVLAEVGRGWVPWLDDALLALLRGHGTADALYWPLLELCGQLALLRLAMVAVRDREATIGVPAAAASGARLTALALWLRLAVAMFLALPAAALVRSPSTAVFLLQGRPMLAIALMALCAIGLLRMAGSCVEGLPAFRMTAGAAAILWWAGADLSRMARSYELQEFSDLVDRVTEPWSMAGPLIAVAGLALAGTAIAVCAAARGDERFRELAAGRTLLFAVLSASEVVLPRLWTSSGTRDLLLLGLLTIGGLVAIASLFSRAAEMLASGPTLPPARVLAPTDRRGGGGDPDTSGGDVRM